jgi:hypothetical protein
MIEFFGTIDSALIMHANQVTLGFSLLEPFFSILLAGPSQLGPILN